MGLASNFEFRDVARFYFPRLMCCTGANFDWYLNWSVFNLRAGGYDTCPCAVSRRMNLAGSDSLRMPGKLVEFIGPSQRGPDLPRGAEFKMGKPMLLIMLFVAGAALSWGLYVPTVHVAQGLLKSPLRAFLFVGVAYFITAVVVPAIFVFALNWDPTVKAGAVPNFGPVACMTGLFGGILGAAGALCIIFAVANGGSPLYVAPLVFAGAPIINTIATITYFNPAKTMPDWRFFMGLALAAVGAAMVMIFKPASPPHGAAPAGQVAPASPGGH